LSLRADTTTHELSDMTKILIVDDHSVIRSGMKTLLEFELPDVQVQAVATVSDALHALEDFKTIDLLLLDLNLPDSSGFDGLARLKQADPAMPIALISGDEDGDTIRRASEAGADGFIPKTADPEVLIHAVGLLLKGEVFSPRVLFDQSVNNPNVAPSPASIPPLPLLIDRQTSVYDLILKGLSNKEIARQLLLTESTVKTHVAAILQKFQVNSRGKLIAQAGFSDQE
jgi:two-component system nitrate/nitrite response regulator NarL